MQGFNFFLMQTARTYLSTKVEQSKCINRPVDVIFLPFFIGTNFTGWYTETTSVLSVLLKNLIYRKYLLKGSKSQINRVSKFQLFITHAACPSKGILVY